MVARGIERRREHLDQLARHCQLALGDFRLAVAGVLERRRWDHLVGVDERHQHQGVALDAQSDEMLLLAQHEATDPDLAGLAHRVDHQAEGLSRPDRGSDVVGGLEHQRIDLVEVDELLDLDQPCLAGGNRVELLGFDDDVLAGRELIALDQILESDLLAVGAANPLLLDPLAVLAVQLVELDVLALDGVVELDRYVHQAKGDRATPDRPRHNTPSCSCGHGPRRAHRGPI